MFTEVEKLWRAGLMRDSCCDRVPTVGGSPRLRGRRRYDDDAPRAAIRRSMPLALPLTTNQYVQKIRRS